MEISHKSVTLSTSEMSFLWQNYIGDTLIICMFKHFLQHIDDPDIENLIKQGLALAERHTQQAKELFESVEFPIPKGFGPQDVYLNGPRLFSDKFYTYYLQQALRGAMANYTLAFSMSHREDVRSYFMHALHEDTELFNKTTNLMLEKGLAQRPPQVPIPKQVDFVSNKEFLVEWFGQERPLSSIEITNIYMNIETNLLGSALMTAFSQTAEEKKLKNYFKDGLQIATSHLETFTKILAKDSLSFPPTWNPEVTDAAKPAFSDKLMLFHGGLATAAGVGNYGLSMSASQRLDLGALYGKLSAQIGRFAEKGAKLTIEHGWLEQPPMSIDRDGIMKKMK
ncbi:DUF3231 family protein [Bacillus suaedaesalsae]|uniref:DUF3231 family protein n=1 Tax=Bacillus suaedaesalsae TaxID=2810349 RepID=A0ABS2DCR4_9BACI|nr:DUF3231 family protein [Bacillus suaedaesalsae]MBM6616251.1 DUF3231 family protein [Bacillus suaedaesalsae]